MSGNARRLTAAVLGLILAMAIQPSAHAHKLLGEHRVAPGRRVIVESWFETGDSPLDAPVKVYRADGSLLCEGKLDAKGLYVFSFDRVETLRVVVTDGTGHTAEVKVPAKDLAAGLCSEASAVALCLSPAGPLTAAAVFREGNGDASEAVQRFADRSAPWPVWNIVIGCGVVLALALVAMAVQRARAARTT